MVEASICLALIDTKRRCNFQLFIDKKKVAKDTGSESTSATLVDGVLN